MGCAIIGCGKSLPALAVANDDLTQLVDTSDEWITTRTGIKPRRIAVGETNVDMAEAAARQAMGLVEGGYCEAPIDPESIDLVVYSTCTPDVLVPSCAALVRRRLGLVNAVAFDVNAACSGFIYAMSVAESMMASSALGVAGAGRRNKVRRALVIGSERLTRITNWKDRTTCVLFGDGAGAAVLGAGKKGNPLALSFSTSPDVAALDVPGLAGTSPFAGTGRPASRLSMDGRRVFRFAVAAICDAVEGLAAKAGIAVADIDHLVLHQANERILAAAVKRLGIDDARVARTLRDTGNISSACIPLALDRLARAGELEDGDLVALVGFGAGLDIGACLLRWK